MNGFPTSNMARWMAVFCIAFSSVCTACTSSSDSGDCIEIGLLASYTGEYGANGFNFERAVQLAVDQVNDAGGVAGKKLCVAAADEHSNVALGEKAAGDLLATEQLPIVLGPDNLDLVVKVRSMLAEYGIFTILPGITVDDLLTGTVGMWLELGPRAGDMGCALARRIYDGQLRKIAVVYDQQSLLSRASAEAIPVAIERYELPTSPAEVTLFPIMAEQSTSDVIEAVALAQPDALTVITSASVAANLIQDGLRPAKGGGWFFGPNALTNALLDNVPPGFLEDAVGIGPAFVNQSDAAALDAEFEREYDDAPFILSYYYFDATALVALAIEKAYQDNGNQLPTAAQIHDAVRGVANGPGQRITWQQLGDGLTMIRGGQDIDYTGITGALTLDASGKLAQTAVEYIISRAETTGIVYEGRTTCPL